MKGDELDQILARGLRSYADAEPRPGLEKRVINRVRETREIRSLKWLRWAISVPVFASLLIIAITFWPKRERTPEFHASSTPVAKSVSAAPVIPKAAEAAVRRPRSQRVLAPKREQFPTPVPLTEEERALLAFANGVPHAEEVMATQEKRMSEPLEIAEIHIEPLQEKGDEQR
ncbi:MAG: hypothetical protein JOY62_13770 [Acidobacteriaceae bacterium]|nr:hypothetical protein [Acidobacteriaceae bacterium]MBV9781030.1 hypothetical protein [Acidobacteriaceae bacterium]